MNRKCIKCVRGIIVSIFLLSMATSSWANCNQSINVDQSKRLPPNTLLFGGMKCSDFEKLRGNLFLDELSDVSSDKFEDYNEWKKGYNSIVLRVINAQQQLQDAKKADASDAMKTSAIASVSTSLANFFTLLGCNAPPTAPTIISCVGSIVMTNFGFVYGMTSSNFNENAEKAEAVLTEAKNSLQLVEEMGDAIIPEVKQRYLQQFNFMCSQTKEHCM